MKIKKGMIIILSLPFYLFFMLKHRRWLSIRWLSSDIIVFYHTFIRKEFSINIELTDINYIIDAGANTGLTTLYFNYKTQKILIPFFQLMVAFGITMLFLKLLIVVERAGRLEQRK